jgi:eukaryotic-like serine/threonine-protein kinase
MSPLSIRQTEEIFATALELPAPEQEPFLDQACAGDRELRERLGELLADADAAARFFTELSGEIARSGPLELELAAQPEIRIGVYRTLRVLGHGGMGVVYLAERVDRNFDQRVALKLLHLDMTTPRMRARFLAERQLLAGLAHPGIARLQDGGVTDEGRPYFVMELVDGVPITRYCESRHLSIESTLRLFLEVVEAVSYLHRNLIVHRDLKPGNVLVNRQGHAKLLDFGIAKLLAGPPEEVLATLTGERLLTPEYAAPEQLAKGLVTTATDVYGLGVTLYELLAGRRPFERRTTGGDPAGNQFPPPPSARLASRGEPGNSPGIEQPSTAPPPRRRRIDPDLDTICLKALRTEPERRYPSAEQLGQDIERYLGGLPVLARRSTFGYRLRKFARRHRAAVVTTVVLVAVLAVAYLRERTLRGEAEGARGEAQAAASQAAAVGDFLGDLLSSVDPSRAQGRDVTVADVLGEAASRLAEGEALPDQPEVEAALQLTLGRTYTALGRLVDAKRHLERALELRANLTEADPGRLEVLEALGRLYLEDGLPELAVPPLQRVFDLRTERLGDDHPDTLTAMSELANALFRLNRLDEVEELDRRTLSIRRRTLGEEDPETIRATNSLAATLFARAHYTEAAELFERALAGQRRQLGADHPDTLKIQNNLGAAYVELGRYSAAEPVLQAALAGRERVLGTGHAATGTSLHNLAVDLLCLGRLDEAEALFEQAIEARDRVAGRAGYLYSRSYLADVWREQGRFDEAEALYRSTLAAQIAEGGAENPNTLRTTAALAELRLRQGHTDEAGSLISRALAAQERTLGEASPDALASRVTLARTRLAEGRLEEAIVTSERAVALGGRALAEDHPLVLEARFERARAHARQGSLREAAGEAESIYQARSRILGGEHPRTVEALRLLVEIHTAAGQPDEAASFRSLLPES